MCVQVLASGLKVEKRERNFRSLVGTFLRSLETVKMSTPPDDVRWPDQHWVKCILAQ